MSRRSKSRSPSQQGAVERPLLLSPPHLLQQKLNERIDIGRKLLERDVPNSYDLDLLREEYRSWSRYNRDLLQKFFSSPLIANEYEHERDIVVYYTEPPFTAKVNRLTSTIRSKISYLESTVDRLELFELLEDTSSSRPENVSNKNRNVFVVHGHDEEAKVTVARMLENVKLMPIVLHEQPNMGRTLIEKFEENADVGFAIIIITPDDIGASKHQRDELSPRARQNVILELGYFVGKLGRERVCVLQKGDVELPSDVLGIVHVPLDSRGAWKYELAREIKSAQIDIDMNDIR